MTMPKQPANKQLPKAMLEFLHDEPLNVGAKLSSAFDDARQTDGDTAEELGWLTAHYVVATGQQRKIIDNVFLALCGWTLPTLIRFAMEDRREKIGTDYADQERCIASQL
jgi:hypothetical protein